MIYCQNYLTFCVILTFDLGKNVTVIQKNHNFPFKMEYFINPWKYFYPWKYIFKGGGNRWKRGCITVKSCSCYLTINKSDWGKFNLFESRTKLWYSNHKTSRRISKSQYSAKVSQTRPPPRSVTYLRGTSPSRWALTQKNVFSKFNF